MKASVDEFVSVLERLSEKVEELEARLSVLERRATVAGPVRNARAETVPIMPVPLQDLSSSRPGAALAIIGRIFLGLAGAYLLRAVSESGIVPQVAVVPTALAYGFAWLVWAAVPPNTSGYARNAHAITAVAILSPMLWELSVRFQIMPPAVTAAILAGFVIVGSALAWKRDLAGVVGISGFAAVTTGLALFVATRTPAPFTVALLVMALATETAACRDRWVRLRPITAFPVDLAIFFLILIYARAGGVSEEYRPLATPIVTALLAAGFLIYATSTLFRTVILKRKISIFEIAQAVMSFVLATSGIVRISRAAEPALGICCLLAAGALYLTALQRTPQAPLRRNYYVFATWAGALFVLGSLLLFPATVAGVWLVLAALVALYAGVRGSQVTLSVHGAVYMFVGAFASGLLQSVGQILAGSPPFTQSWALWIAAAAAVAGYAMAARAGPEKDSWNQRLLRFVLAGLASSVVAAIGVILIASLLALALVVGDALLGVSRTFAVSFVALVLARQGSRRKRIELIWLAYAAIAFCTLKLLFEDLRLGTAGSMAASLFFYGLTWVLVPRMARLSER